MPKQKWQNYKAYNSLHKKGLTNKCQTLFMLVTTYYFDCTQTTGFP